MKYFKKKKIRKWDAILRKRFFDISYGFFTVLKVWRAKEYMRHAENPDGSRWRTFYIFKIKTDEGAIYMLPQHHFDDITWKRDYPKKEPKEAAVERNHTT